MKKIILSLLLLQYNYNMEFNRNKHEIYSTPITINKNLNNPIRLDLFLTSKERYRDNNSIIKRIQESMDDRTITDTITIIEILQNILKTEPFMFIPREQLIFIPFSEQYRFNNTFYIRPDNIKNTNIEKETLNIVFSQENNKSDLLTILYHINKSEETKSIEELSFSEQRTISCYIPINHNKYSNIIIYKQKNKNNFERITPNKEIKDCFMIKYMNTYFEKKIFEQYTKVYPTIIKSMISEFMEISMEMIQKINILSKIIKIYYQINKNDNHTEEEEINCLQNIINQLPENEQIIFNNLGIANIRIDDIHERKHSLEKNYKGSDLSYYINNQEENINNFLGNF
jgi:hypothetical protein